MIPPKNMIKFSQLPMKKIQIFKKVHIFSSFPNFAFSLVGNLKNLIRTEVFKCIKNVFICIIKVSNAKLLKIW